jgi:hypothetical protein
MRSHVPAVTIGILELPGTIAIELILDRSQRLGPRLDCALERGVRVIEVDVDRDRRASDRLSGRRCSSLGSRRRA